MSSCSLSPSTQTSFLHSTLEQFFAEKKLKLKIDKADPVAVIALQRYLLEHQYVVGQQQQVVNSYRYDLTVTDGVCQAKCVLDRSLNHLVHKNLLRSGIDIHLRQCSFVYNEMRLGQGCVCIESIDCGSGVESDILRKAKDLESLPILSKDSIGNAMALQNDAPLHAGRKHYLSLWNNEDPEGKFWVPDIPPADVVLDVSKIALLCDLESSFGSTFRPLPLLVRVMHKSRLRYYGRIGHKIDYPYQAYFEVADQSGTMSLVLWNELCPEWYQRLSVGTVLYLQNYTLKHSYPHRSRPRMDAHRMRTFHTVEICLNPRNPTAAITVVPPKRVSSQWGLPEVSYQFTTRSELENLANNASCDVIGLVTFVGRVERVKSKGNTDPEKYWTYRWVHAVDGTSNLPFVLEIFASSQPEIFNGICPMTYLLCTQMRMCQVEGSLPYLTSSCETQIFTTGFHRGQPYVSDPRVRSFIQWTKTLKESVMLRKTVVGGHYCFPHAPQIFTQSVADGSAQVPLVAANDLKRELESLHYREHKRLAIQGQIMAVQYLRCPEEELSDQEQQTAMSVGMTVVPGPDPVRDQSTAEMIEASGEERSPRRPKRKRPKEREVKRYYITRARMQTKRMAGHHDAEDELVEQEEEIDSEPEEEEEDGPLEGNLDQTRSIQKQVSADTPKSDSAPGDGVPDGDGSSWESSSWPVQRQELSEHLLSGGVFPESHSQRFTFDDRNRLLQQSNLHPARWMPEPTADTNSPVPCQGYYRVTILGINQKLAIDAAFVPVLSSEDPRSLGLLQDPHDNTLLSCLSAGFLCPLSDPLGQSEALPEPEEILGTAEELKDTHFVCVLDCCHLGGEKVEVLINKVYKMTDIVLV